MAIAFLSAQRSKDPATQVGNFRLLCRTRTTVYFPAGWDQFRLTLYK